MQTIENTLKTRMQSNRADTFLVIVPTDAARVKRQRELVGYHPNRAVTNLRVHTIIDFVERLYKQVRPVRTNISHGIQNLWLHEIANPQSDNPDAHRYDTFRPNPNIAVPDSTLSLVVEKINHLKERGETSENIAADNPTKVDLTRIYDDYETKLEDGWIDEQGDTYTLRTISSQRLCEAHFRTLTLSLLKGSPSSLKPTSRF